MRTCAHVGSRRSSPNPTTKKDHRARRGSRGGRPVNFDGAELQESQRYKTTQLLSPQAMAGDRVRYDKHALTYRAAIVLHSGVTWAKALSDLP